jgi:hypothetical protein
MDNAKPMDSWWQYAIVVLIIVSLCYLLVTWAPMRDMHSDYDRITVGMELSEVERLLGPGIRITEDDLPESPTHTHIEGEPQSVPIVKEGDAYYRWLGEFNGQRIIVSFANNRVIDKSYRELDL